MTNSTKADPVSTGVGPPHHLTTTETVPMTPSKLAELAHHYATHFALETTTTTRKEIEADLANIVDFQPLKDTDILDAYNELVDEAEDLPAAVLARLNSFVPVINEDGDEVWAKVDAMSDERLDEALVATAAEYAALERVRLDTMFQFAALTRIKQGRTQETAK